MSFNKKRLGAEAAAVLMGLFFVGTNNQTAYAADNNDNANNTTTNENAVDKDKALSNASQQAPKPLDTTEASSDNSATTQEDTQDPAASDDRNQDAQASQDADMQDMDDEALDQENDQKPTPTIKIAVDQNQQLEPNNVLSQVADVPEGSNAEWIDQPDTSKVGIQLDKMRVTFIDGTHEDINFNIEVAPKATDNGVGDAGYANLSSDPSLQAAPMSLANTGYAGRQDSAQPSELSAGYSDQAATLPETGQKDESVMVAVGAATASVGMLLGLAGRKKRLG